MFRRQFTYRWKFPAASAKCRCQSSAVLKANRINEVAKEREWVRAKRMRKGQISTVNERTLPHGQENASPNLFECSNMQATQAESKMIFGGDIAGDAKLVFE